MGIPSLTTTASSILGFMLVESAAYFQAGSAELIGAEGDKIQATVNQGSVSEMTVINRKIGETMSALSNLEDNVLKKIAAGTHLRLVGWTDWV